MTSLPNRIIREGINDSLRINALPLLAELFYRKLQLLVDDYGRYEAEPILLRAKLYGLRSEVTVADVSEHLLALSSGDQPLVILYDVLGKKFLEIQQFGQRTRTEKYPSPALADNCEHLRARASNTRTPPNTNTRSTPKEESARETIRDAGFVEFEKLARSVGMIGSEGPGGDWDRAERIWWPSLGYEKQLRLLDRFRKRIQGSEYDDPAYIPGVVSFFNGKWDNPPRPRPKPNGKASDDETKRAAAIASLHAMSGKVKTV